jgi:dethiobiotin synthetase
MNYFITGIDTDIGKTFVTKGLALSFENANKKVGVFKPLQSGAIKSNNTYLAPDLEAIKKLSKNINTKCSYLLEGEVSPALAARLSGIKIDIEKIKSDFKNFSSQNDITFVEGAGGILAPATDEFLCADLIKELNIPIIIVTVPFLGRLNHTLLTIHYAKTMNIPIKGIIINKIPNKTDDLATKNFINELKMYTDVEILAQIKEINADNKELILEEFKNLTNLI